MKQLVLAVILATVSTAASARVESGSANGLSWQARSRIVGVTSTATVAGGGNPIYLPDRPRLNGVASLIMEYANGDAFICTGSLLSDRRSILTAAHCVTDSNLTNPVRTTAYFYGGSDDPQTFFGGDGIEAVEVSSYFVNPNYTGEVIDQNDIAVVRLADLAPSFATTFVPLPTLALEETNFNVAGYGARSDTGGDVGANLGVGRLRQGDNRYDFKLGDAAFAGFFDGFFGDAPTENSILSDFDNGTAVNDASCQLGSFFRATGPRFCNRGRGAREVGVAGGDSGGPGFVNGRLATVTSYGLSFGPDFGDIDDDLNSSFGEFSGYVPVGLHIDFIRSVANVQVPEPSTWAIMVIGFGAAGASLRRSNRRLAAA